MKLPDMLQARLPAGSFIESMFDRFLCYKAIAMYPDRSAGWFMSKRWSGQECKRLLGSWRWHEKRHPEWGCWPERDPGTVEFTFPEVAGIARRIWGHRLGA